MSSADLGFCSSTAGLTPVPRDPRQKPWPKPVPKSGSSEYIQMYKDRFREISEFDIQRTCKLGIFFARWIDSLAGMGSCSIAKKNNGKMFFTLAPGVDGVPCAGNCTSKDWCRCSMSFVIPHHDSGPFEWADGAQEAYEQYLFDHPKFTCDVPKGVKTQKDIKRSFWKKLFS